MHCHQEINSDSSIILVSQDGVQHQPIHFPKGSHLFQFLNCLENGLNQYNFGLVPEIWSDIQNFEKCTPFILEKVPLNQKRLQAGITELNFITSISNNSLNSETINNKNLSTPNFESFFLSPINNMDLKKSISSSLDQLNLTDEQLEKNKLEGYCIIY